MTSEITNTKVHAVAAYAVDDRTTYTGNIPIPGLNEKVEAALVELAAEGFTELVDAKYSVAVENESGDFDTTYSVLLIVRGPSDS